MTATEVFIEQPQQADKDAARIRLTSYLDLLDAVGKLSPAMRLDLAHFILRSLSDELDLGDSSLGAAQEMLATANPPDDEQARHIIQEARSERYTR